MPGGGCVGAVGQRALDGFDKGADEVMCLDVCYEGGLRRLRTDERERANT